MIALKKLLLSIGVIGIFIAYTLVLRHQHSGPVIALPSLKNGSASAATTSNGNSSTTAVASYKNGTYTGSVANAFYGNVQVRVTIQNGNIANIQFLQYPNDNPNSQNINSQATPLLRQEAIQAQNAQVDTITGATDTSQAFTQSLSAALSQAQA